MGFGQETHHILDLVRQCKQTNEIDEKIAILLKINANLPKYMQLKIPSLITRDYVKRAIAIIEERID